MTKQAFKFEVRDFFMSLQDDICTQLEKADKGAKFQEDNWVRKEGGGGRTRIIEEGKILEKGGVNFSEVEGELPENIQKALSIDSTYFFATGVSIVIHPISPMVPIIHMNVRYFETKKSKESPFVEKSWFGGGIDLTPHYVNKADASFFHGELKKVCDQFDSSYYDKFKKWADDYFFIKHRDETRGVGGVFFDKLSGKNEGMDHVFSFVRGIGNVFAPIYTHLMAKNASKLYNDENRSWQNLRRGRYVEFNLVLDKGTKFGLDTNGRIESILMSLPNNAGWTYNYQAKKGSKEEETLSLLKKGINWV
jgi:coproporphyrinogen III oxidase